MPLGSRNLWFQLVLSKTVIEIGLWGLIECSQCYVGPIDIFVKESTNDFLQLASMLKAHYEVKLRSQTGELP